MNMRGWMVVTLLALAGLAPPAAGQIAADRRIMVRTLTLRADRWISDTLGTPYEVPVNATGAFLLLRDAYAELKIPLEVNDSVQRAIGTSKVIRRGDLGGRRLSLYFECGSVFTGAIADAYRIDVTLVTFVAPHGEDGSTIRTVLLGQAINVTEGANPTAACTSTGELEKRIHQMLLKRLKT